jgi:hypothetical protein
MNTDNEYPMGGLAMQAGGVPSFMKLIKKLTKDINKAEKDGDLATSLAKRKELNSAIQFGVNDPLMPRAQPLTQAEIRMYAERMAPQVAGELTRGTGTKTIAGKSQKQFKREQTLPVNRKVVPGAVDPSAPLPYMTLEDQKGSVLLGLPGDPTLARVNLLGIDDVTFERPVTLHGGPRYGDEEKLWASNLGAATGLLSAADRASRQYGNAPVIASYTKMPSGFGFAQHYLESLLQYQRPDQLTKKAQQALTKDIKEGFINAQGKRVTFPDFPGFGDMDTVLDMALTDTNLRKHLADRLEKSKKYGLRPAGDVQFAVSHPELTNLETGASGFTLGELTPGRLTESAHPTYSHDIPGKVLGQMQYSTPYDLLYRDQLNLIRNNPEAPEFNTLKGLGARQQIDEQLANEINEYQERMRQLLGRKKGGAVNMDEGGLVFYGVRQSGDGIKGKGYFGPLAGREGTVTELSAEDESGEFPLVVPTLTAEELELLLAGKDPTSEIMGKARSWADTRRKRGKSPFAEPMELRMPKPKAEGGSVSLTDLPDDVTPSNWREHLQKNVLADARALLGVKDGGVINLDELIEKSLKKKDGGVINLDELIEWTMAKEKHRKMKEGGGVHMQGGGNPGEVSGEMSKPKPLSIPEPITDLVEALRRQFEKEKRSMRKPGAAQDVLMRGPVAGYVGAPADIVGMGGEFLDYVQKKIPALRKPASVMDTGPEKEPPMGYAPALPLSPEGSYGTTKVQEMLGKAGLTTSEERPLFEMGAMFGAPVAGYSSLKAGKALAPTAKDMLDIQLQRMMKPYQMAIAPEGKAGKVKAPANSSGYYNPVEKAALNLQRKQGSGSAMVSDMKKTPGVNDERLAELGLGDLTSRPNVTREEVLAAVEQNRIPLRETVRRDATPKSEQLADEIDSVVEDLNYLDNDSREYAEMSRYLDGLKEQQKKLIGGDGPAMFGPRTHEDYNMPGGENYREIRVGLPSSRPSIKNMSRDEYNAAVNKADREGVQDFMNPTHHGDEPNVLFHLRVADHTDVEGKKGLLIDELQSDWHQKGRNKGYKGDIDSATLDQEMKDIIKERSSLVKEFSDYARKNNDSISPEMQARWNEFKAREDALDEKKRQITSAVPNAPFKDNWYQLGLKRAIKEAADTGMDRVYLTTGARQNERYSLQKHVDKLQYEPSTQTLDAWKDGQLVVSKTVPKDDLPSFVGKSAADKLLETELVAGKNKTKHELSGLDLDVGGAGMKQYYDKNYLNFLKKYAKQFDATVGETTLPGAAKKKSDLSTKEMHDLLDKPEFKKELERIVEQETAANRNRPSGEILNEAWNKAMSSIYGEKVYYIDITPKMRDSAKKGQSYKDGGAAKSI